MKHEQERCDACGRFVPECHLVIEDVDDENSRCICFECDKKLSKYLPKGETAENVQPVREASSIHAGRS